MASYTGKQNLNAFTVSGNSKSIGYKRLTVSSSKMSVMSRSFGEQQCWFRDRILSLPRRIMILVTSVLVSKLKYCIQLSGRV